MHTYTHANHFIIAEWVIHTQLNKHHHHRAPSYPRACMYVCHLFKTLDTLSVTRKLARAHILVHSREREWGSKWAHLIVRVILIKIYFSYTFLYIGVLTTVVILNAPRSSLALCATTTSASLLQSIRSVFSVFLHWQCLSFVFDSHALFFVVARLHFTYAVSVVATTCSVWIFSLFAAAICCIGLLLLLLKTTFYR